MLKSYEEIGDGMWIYIFVILPECLCLCVSGSIQHDSTCPIDSCDGFVSSKLPLPGGRWVVINLVEACSQRSLVGCPEILRLAL